MASKTLLEIVQDILNDLDGDAVNSIDDTVESMQVTQIVRTTYEKLLSVRDDWPFLRTLSAFTGLADTANPTKMGIPSGMNKIYWVKYNGKEVCYMDPKAFNDLIEGREEQTGIVDADGFVINRDPLYWTSYDDESVWFDGYDSDVDVTLQQSKTSVYAVVEPAWDTDDDFIPRLPPKMFPTLIADAKGTAFLVLKQQANTKEEAFAQSGKIRMQHTATRINDAEAKTNSAINYGRK